MLEKAEPPRSPVYWLASAFLIVTNSDTEAGTACLLTFAALHLRSRKNVFFSIAAARAVHEHSFILDDALNPITDG